MYWYRVEFAVSKQDELVNGASEDDVRGFLKQAYAETDSYSIDESDIDASEVSRVESLDDSAIDTVKGKLSAPSYPFRAIDRTSGSMGSVVFWESRTNAAGKNSLYHGELGVRDML